MPPKRQSLPLLFALSLAALFLLSYHYHSSTPSLSLSSPTFSSESSINPNPFPPSFSFTIKLLAFDRPASLRRCLRSLSAAFYAPDRVDLHLFLDHLPVPAGGSDSPSRNVSLSHRILEMVDAFEWKHGKKMVHYRTGNVGLQAQWLEAWWPASDDEFVFVVEDDLELSPLYYRFLKALIGRYYYDRENYSPSIYGASLQRPRFVAGKHGNKLKVDSGTHLFLYQMVGTWGQLLFPKPWKEFRLWYDVQKAKGSKPILQGMVTTGWYKKMGERIWTPWFIKFIHTQGYYNIYTNFLRDRALSTSHRDAGVNYGKAAGPDSYLLDESSLDFNLWEMQPLRNLKWYDFCFREVLPGRVVRSFDELGTVLNTLQKQKMVVFISLYRGEERITRNLLCHLERLNIQNYIFVGGDSRFLLDLARRGHPVIDADQLLNNARGIKLKALGLSDTKLAKEIWVKSSIIKKCLESGYDSWVIDVNMIPLSSSFFGLPDTSYNFMVAKDVELMFVKSSEGSVHVWTHDFILKVAAAVNSLLASSSVSVGQRHFVYFVSEALKEMGAATVWTFDEYLFGVRIGINAANHASLGSTKKIVLWSQHVGLDLIQRELVSMDMWLIDEDFSCSAVVCHG